MKSLIFIYLLSFLFIQCAKEEESRQQDYFTEINMENIGITNKLDGSQLTYGYENGMAFTLKFNSGKVSYRNLAGTKPEKWWGPFAYQARITKNGEYFASWYEDGYGDHVTLLINLDTKVIYGSALIPKGSKKPQVIFSEASISEIRR